MTSFENWNLDIVNVFQGVCIPYIRPFHSDYHFLFECDFFMLNEFAWQDFHSITI